MFLVEAIIQTLDTGFRRYDGRSSHDSSAQNEGDSIGAQSPPVGSVARDHDAALFTAITRPLATGMREFLEVTVFDAAAIETLGAMPIAQLFGCQGQVAAPATHGGLAFNQEF